MDLTTNLTNFFYNILPGAYFIILYPKFYTDVLSKNDFFKNIRTDETFILIIFLILSLLIGFIFQGLTKVIRQIVLDSVIIEKVIQNNNRDKIWKEVKKKFETKKLLSQDSKETNINIFYLMDNYINSAKTNYLPMHFSARTSLWANLAWANFFLLVIRPNDCLKVIILLFFIISLIVSWLNFVAQQDTVLKSFLMEKEIFKN